jgi:hypothetical protein
LPSTELCELTCHHFQAREPVRHHLLLTYASMNWQFRVSHYGLFLPLQLFATIF